MIKTYQEDLTLAAPLYSETDELWPLSPSDPNWYYNGLEAFEWVSGKGIGDCDPSSVLSLRKMHRSCAIIDCTVHVLLELSGDEFSYEFKASIGFYTNYLSCRVSISNATYMNGSVFVILQNDGLEEVESIPQPIESGVIALRFYDDGTHYRLSKNGTTLASIEKTPDNVAQYAIREESIPSFYFRAFNAVDEPKFYLQSVDFEYDEFVSNPFWTDLINCHETT